eukprot:12398946-Karenia_brevis.AAC.1
MTIDGRYQNDGFRKVSKFGLEKAPSIQYDRDGEHHSDNHGKDDGGGDSDDDDNFNDKEDGDGNDNDG